MRKDAREVDQLVEHVEHRPLLGTATPRNDFAARALLLHQILAGDDRLDDPHAVLVHERRDLVANRRERAELNLDQLVAVDDVDAIAADALLDASAVGRVVRLELSMQRGFHTCIGCSDDVNRASRT